MDPIAGEAPVRERRDDAGANDDRNQSRPVQIVFLPNTQELYSCEGFPRKSPNCRATECTLRLSASLTARGRLRLREFGFRRRVLGRDCGRRRGRGCGSTSLRRGWRSTRRWPCDSGGGGGRGGWGAPGGGGGRAILRARFPG